ncbi:nuclear pore glycoprotein p62-like [Littorina saxatilis]|uniref:Nucleoporin NSP1-like C-terminal domain-containing protein n=1 Tax=Littorina saxatilis TaxID=31220 RepID=A0AAN9B4V4_9CAEN
MFGGAGGQKPGGFSFGQPSAGTGATAGGFSFGGTNTGASAAPGAGTGGFAFGTPASTAAAPAQPATGGGGGFSFGATGQPAGQGGGFSFGGPTATAPTTAQAPAGGAGGFSFGGAGNAPATQAPGPGAAGMGGFNFSFGGGGGAPTTTTTTTPAASTGFSFGGGGGGLSGATQTTASSGPTLGTMLGATPVATATTGSSLMSLLGGGPATNPTQPQLGLGLGAAVTTQGAGALGGFSFGATAPSAAPASSAPPAFSFSTPSAAAPPAATATTANTGGFAFSTASASTPASGATLGTSAPTLGLALGAPKLGAPTTAAASTASTGFSLMGLTTSAPSLATNPTSAAGSTAAVAALGAKPGRQMTYKQLEEETNKWMSELEEQERNFLLQATQVNAWDRLVIENGEKTVQLNSDLERVKLEQQKLDHELDFVHSQQRELAEMLTPLDAALEAMPAISYQQHADLEREHTYQLAESLDAQLKRMGQDLKEIIDRLNSGNTKPDPEDPVQQITKILNAHMDSLMWVDRQTGNLNRRVEDLSKVMESEKKEQERNFRLAYS